MAYSAHYPPSPAREFTCEFCPLAFDRNYDLKRHTETHSGEKPYVCDQGCGKAFSRKDAVKRHQTTYPFCPPRPYQPAAESRGPPQYASQYLYPYTGHHSPDRLYHASGYSETPQYRNASGWASPCDDGPWDASMRFGYAASPTSPTGSFPPSPLYYGAAHPASPTRPYPCECCPASFDRLHDLKRHKLRHAGQRPYVCNGGCEKSFTRRDALRRHQQLKECGGGC
ncbi:hypothetical protein MKEN_01054200 [Mycena kentingensis (nom. inval.)]|nr:hypothetical protein MKEN_01054200 [Mycena kentingensis (nom. inval.)]